MVQRLRLAVAGVVVLASLLAISAWFKNATCACGSSGLPWETIAIAATVAAGMAIVVYLTVTAVARTSDR